MGSSTKPFDYQGSTLTNVLGIIATLAMVVALIPLAQGGSARAQTTSLEASTNEEAAVAWSQETFPSGSEQAYLGREDVFADLLASGGAQGRFDAPLLLTDTAQLTEVTADELSRLGVQIVTILGGEDAVSQAVADDLESRGYVVQRIFGETRIETAVAIAEDLFPDATEAILARAFGTSGGDETQAFADSLAGGGFAADFGIPVLLTETDVLTGNTRAYFDGSAITRVYVLGGQSAVSDDVVAELESMGIEVVRVSGANRFATAVEIAEARGFASADDANVVILVEGQADNAYASGFAAAAAADLSDAPIVLSNGTGIPPETRTFLEGGSELQTHDCPTETASPTPTDSESENGGILPLPLSGGEEDGSPSPSPCPEHSDTELICAPFVTEEACEEADRILHGDDAGASPSDSPSESPSESESENGGILPLP